MRNWKLLLALIVSCGLILGGIYVFWRKPPPAQVTQSERPPTEAPVETSLLSHCYLPDSYNHEPFPEFEGELTRLSSGYALHPDAAAAFLELQAAAAEDFVELFLVSAFRSEEEQRYLFYDVARQRGQTLEERAEVSAPPGHSEHATGLAIDVNSLEGSFAGTTSYAWLQANAEDYGFELSFPKDNEMGIAFEPWHWRFVGSDYAKQILCQQEIPVEEP